MYSQRTKYLPQVLIVLGLMAAAACVAAFPAVQGLGSRVKLPVFHGAMTWVNLMLFTLMGIAALAWLALKREIAYRWEEALRWVAIPMWITGSVLGMLAAMNTWDFTGSKASRFAVVAADPRLTAQFWIMLGGLLVIGAGLLLDERYWKAVLDVTFVAAAWYLLLQAILGPGRALHPDSPVLNSDELGIKALFFGMVISIAVASLAGAWWITRVREGKALDAVEGKTSPAEDGGV